MRIPIWNNLKNKIKKKSQPEKAILPKDMNRDQVDLNLWGVRLSVSRETKSDVPTELSVIIPRVEFRQSCQQAQGTCNTEIILNSITVVLAPRHQPEDRSLFSKK